MYSEDIKVKFLLHKDFLVFFHKHNVKLLTSTAWYLLQAPDLGGVREKGKRRNCIRGKNLSQNGGAISMFQ